METSNVDEFLDSLKTKGVLQNSTLETLLRTMARKDVSLGAGIQAVLTNALQEMNVRESGVYTAAAIMIGLINSMPSSSG
ncbi:MAG: hypothetical protein JWM39_107 [Parcubacteria group bacterium]|nr:hypothetical protein [Parcubacteria group bacterium]